MSESAIPASQDPGPGPGLPEYPLYGSFTSATFASRDMDRGVALVVRVVGISQPIFIDDRVHYALTLADLPGELRFKTVPLCDQALVERAQTAMHLGTRMVAFGHFEPYGRAKRAEGGPSIRINLHDLRRQDRPTDLLAPRPGELAAVDQLIDQHAGRGGLLERHITDHLARLRHAATNTLSARFSACIRLVILQALSAGQVNPGVNPRLSVCFHSTSGTGKKILSQYAAHLAPLSRVVKPAEVSPVGLSARVEQRAGESWQATPGAFPRLSGGTCIIEDLHRLERSKNAITAILMSVLEDGHVAPTRAASADYEAECAVMINSNPLSVREGELHGGPTGPMERAGELAVAVDLLTRLDVLVNTGLGDDAAQSAEEIVMAPVVARRHELDEALDPAAKQEERRLRLLIARLLDRIPTVDMAAVALLMGKLMKDVSLIVRGHAATLTGPTQHVFEADGMLRRIANSIRKLVGAAARLDGRAVANEADVQVAWEMLSYKIEVIRWLCGHGDRIRPLGSRDKQVEEARRASERRLRDILRAYGGKGPVSAEEIAAGQQLNLRAVRRELGERGYRAMGGQYTLPTEVEHDEAERERTMVGQPAVAQPVRVEEEDEVPETAEADDIIQQDKELMPLPSALVPMLEVLDEVVGHPRLDEYGDTTTLISETLVEVMLRESGEDCDRYSLRILGKLQDLEPRFGPGAPELDGPSWDAFRAGMEHPDREMRGRFAAAFFRWARLPEKYLWEVSSALREPGEGMPAGLRRDLEILLQRYDDERRQWAAAHPQPPEQPAYAW